MIQLVTNIPPKYKAKIIIYQFVQYNEIYFSHNPCRRVQNIYDCANVKTVGMYGNQLDGSVLFFHLMRLNSTYTDRNNKCIQKFHVFNKKIFNFFEDRKSADFLMACRIRFQPNFYRKNSFYANNLQILLILIKSWM